MNDQITLTESLISASYTLHGPNLNILSAITNEKIIMYTLTAVKKKTPIVTKHFKICII